MKFKARSLYIWLAVVFCISFSLFIFNILYEKTLPTVIEKINDSSIGAIFTAIITVLLLSQQSSSEELKERNVRVFEEKSERYKAFIEKLWQVWEDRIVTLDELNDLVKAVSKDIVLYTKPETVGRILDYLNRLADEIKPEQSDFADKVSGETIQNCIHGIIDELAKEIDLGGELVGGNIEKLNRLEQRVLPVLTLKKFKKDYIETLTAFYRNVESPSGLSFSKVEFKNDSFWLQINDSPVYYHIGPLSRSEGEKLNIGFYAEFAKYREFFPYRHVQRGFYKDYLGGNQDFWDWVFDDSQKGVGFRDKTGKDAVNFADTDAIQNGAYPFDVRNGDAVAQKALELIEQRRFQGKTLAELLDDYTAGKLDLKGA